MKNLICPISKERIDEHVTRFNAFFAFLLVIGAFILNSKLLLIFLLADFFIRGYTKMKYSPISYLSTTLCDALNMEKKPIDKAPKIFAARLGLLMTGIITVLFFLNLFTAAMIIAGILVLFAGLEFLFAFCAGCMIYTYFVLPFYKN